MAMGQLPGEGGTDDGEGGVFSEINITPLTDIFLVLLIIFMVTSSVITQQPEAAGAGGTEAGLEVVLPQGGAAADVAVSRKDLAVAVLADGRFVVNGTVVSESELRVALKEARAANPNTMVVVQADEGVPHGKVVQVMEAAKLEGLGQIAIGVREAPR